MPSLHWALVGRFARALALREDLSSLTPHRGARSPPVGWDRTGSAVRHHECITVVSRPARGPNLTP
eukprot:scaffold1930_cov346-Prasinococcus_capsulatus_cf.AAC.16